MFENILSNNQIEMAQRIFPLFNKNFFLTGGTALALLLGHRKSINFDLASKKQINAFDIEKKLINSKINIQSVMVATGDEFSVLIKNIKFTFYFFPFNVPHKLEWKKTKILLPKIIDIAAMNAYALGRRSKWKDYIDIYFILKSGISLDEINSKTEDIFKTNFNSKLFREQLCYFEDIDFSETITYVDENIKDIKIKTYLTKEAIQF